MNNRVFVDIHVLQSVPPSCLNRDDTNSPKTCVYGGARRARVSSQAWKKAMRDMFRERFDESELAIRTKSLIELVSGAIIRQDGGKNETEAKALAAKVLVLAGVIKKETDDVKALFFISRKQAENLAELILSKPDAVKKDAQAVLKAGNGIEICLFGRMVANAPELNEEASSQVAHAISTHKVENEFDYFTAVDDLSPDDNAGAGMLGTVEFNSSTLYRYATLAAHELFSQLNKNETALKKAVYEFTRAFILSIPTGKQNTFAAQTLPDAVMVCVRSDRPVSLAGAFEKPVRGEGYIELSVKALRNHTENLYKDFCGEPESAYVAGQHLETLGERMSLDELLTCVGERTLTLVAGMNQ